MARRTLPHPAIAGIAGVALMLLAGRLSGQDYNWDLLNYHFVSPHLLLGGAYDRNLAPSGLQSWFNPIGYVPAYLAIQTLPPWLASALFAIVAGLNAPLIYLIADRIGADLPRETRVGANYACVAIGMTGALTLSEAGTSFLDDTLSLAILGAVLAVMAAVRTRGSVPLVIAGLLLGAASGLKLTNVVMAAGMAGAVAVLIVTRKLPLSALLALALGGLAGFLLTGGWWAWKLWDAFGNPVFPMFNHLFHAPLAPAVASLDTKYVPHDWIGFLAFPWHVMLGDAAVGAEIVIRDPRYAVLLVASLAVVAGSIARRARDAEALLVATFCLVAYAAWLLLFAILRYAVALEMLSGVVLLAALCALPARPVRRVAPVMILAAFLISLATQHAVWGRVAFSSDWFGVRGIDRVHQTGTVYVLPDDAPLGFLLPAFPDDARFVKIGGDFPLDPRAGLGVRAAAMIQAAPRLRSLAAAPNNADGVATLRRFHLAAMPGTCRTIATKAADVESCALTFTR